MSGASDEYAGLDLDNFLIDVKDHTELDMDVAGSVTAGYLDRTMDGASTISITIFDPDRVLLNSKLWNWTLNVQFDELWFRLVNVSKSGNSITLVFESAVISWMRSHKSPLKVSRNKMTRAEFIKKLVDEIKMDEQLGMPITFFSPQLHKKQPIATPDDRKKAAVKKRDQKAGGLVSSTNFANLKINGHTANRQQLELLEEELDVGVSMGANRKVLQSSIMTVIDESNAENLPGGDQDSRGAFQQQKYINGRRTSWPASGKVTPDAKGYFEVAIKADKDNPHLSLEMLCQTVQRSGTADGSNYKKFKSEAKKILDEYGGGVGGSVDVNYYKQFQFTRGEPGGPKGENTWDCAKRLAGDVQWYFFVDDYKVYYVNRDDLIGQKPIMIIDDDDEGIEVIDFDWDTNKPINEATVTCRADQWFARPGEVVMLKSTMGPAAGRWLVSRINQPFFTDLTSITLRSPLNPKKEPAPTLASTTKEVASAPGDNAGTPKEIIDRIVLPMARKNGIQVTAESVKAANETHGPTVDGGRSDHQGPPEVAWAADMSNGTTTPEEDQLAKDLASYFDIPWTGSGLVSVVHGHYRYQLIYRTNEGGNHYNHVHFGVKKVYITPDNSGGN